MMKKNYPDGQNVKQNEKYYGNSLETAKTESIFLAVRHGRYIDRDSDDRKTFRFTRDETQFTC